MYEYKHNIYDKMLFEDFKKSPHAEYNRFFGRVMTNIRMFNDFLNGVTVLLAKTFILGFHNACKPSQINLSNHKIHTEQIPYA